LQKKKKKKEEVNFNLKKRYLSLNLILGQ
jgi:hypothetical protein